MKTNRRKFLKAGALTGTTLACASAFGAIDKKSLETKLPYKNTYVKNTFVAENEFRRDTPNFLDAPSFEQAKKTLPSPFWKGGEKDLDLVAGLNKF